jgi:hypothetical protein
MNKEAVSRSLEIGSASFRPGASKGALLTVRPKFGTVELLYRLPGAVELYGDSSENETRTIIWC